VFVLAGLILAIGSFVPAGDDYHSIRRSGDALRPPQTTVDAAFASWLRGFDGCRPARAAVPLVLVAAPGGGIRAAFWTTLAVERVSALDTSCGERSVFAASGVSGGALGLVVHSLSPKAPAQESRPTLLTRLGWTAARASTPEAALADNTSLSATGAAMMFRDAVHSFSGLNWFDDRAAVLERSWEERFPALASPFYAGLQPQNTPGDNGHQDWRPLLLLNGTEAATGCRVVVSPLTIAATPAGSDPSACLSPASRDGASAFGALDFSDWLEGCDHGDVRASTAALIAARFPAVSPSGYMKGCANTNTINDLDGGAAENTGLQTILDVWRQLAPLVDSHNACVVNPSRVSCRDVEPFRVVPMVVMVDNHYTAPTAVSHTKVPSQIGALLVAAGAKKVPSETGVLEQRVLSELGRTGFFLVSPTVKPDISAPLGWTLSGIAQDNLAKQLTLDDTPCPDAHETRLATLNCLEQTVSKLRR
jgi:hypothetical protein